MPKSTKPTVYAVERGAYSDYGIVAIFTTKKLAEAAIESMESKYGDERVVGWLLYDHVPPKHTFYMKEWFGGKISEQVRVYDNWDSPPYEGRVTRGLGFNKWNPGGHLGDCYRFWGESKERVHKAFDDYHARRRAEVEGIA